MKKYFSKKSKIHGIGIFINKDINKNEYIDKGIYFFLRFVPIITVGFGDLINHSKTPNCHLKYDLNKNLYNVYSLKNIKKNEELTLNYNNLPWFCCGPELSWKN